MVLALSRVTRLLDIRVGATALRDRLTARRSKGANMADAHSTLTRLKFRPALAAAVVIAVLLFSLAGLTIFWSKPVPGPTVVLDMSDKMEHCRTTMRQQLAPIKPVVDSLYQISDLCYTEVRREALLGDFNIRRMTLVGQQFETLVIMWMVVAITFSGVILAGIQLVAAYRLAADGHEKFGGDQSDLRIEQGHISLKSSVTGLLILTVSFAFFIVFVRWVYMIPDDPSSSEVANAQRVSQSTSTSPHVLPQVGSLGIPPQAVSGASSPQAATIKPSSNTNSKAKHAP
ncbi:hypothetical protein M0D69_01285 [Caballeronia sp. SEWSISQ10-4 2]|uniref:hypothetical protein n=1 Tax=Caballeronia sp. SEWSISQ10-4 2 TaxID=2937438 RepID=UPI0026555FDA|nr:hypothetical protein [Caballeronia sp. SEWSISQ10-4 2]MDN7176676.1 hypothetical protein [Caballeronia sp. SEWSISQ10-4 2]